jgi:hypothetical protein
VGLSEYINNTSYSTTYREFPKLLTESSFLKQKIFQFNQSVTDHSVKDRFYTKAQFVCHLLVSHLELNKK